MPDYPIGFQPDYTTSIPGFQPYQPEQFPTTFASIPGFQPYQEPQQEESWGHWLTDQAISNLPSMALGIGGGAIGSIFGPAGTVAGGMLGGSVGGAIGEAGSQWFRGEDYNPQMIAVSAAANALPGFSEMPGAGVGLKAVGKYALANAVEGAAQNVLTTPFQHQAQLGNLMAPSKWEMPSAGEFASDAAGGAVFGGLTGLGFGAYGHKYGRVPTVDVPPAAHEIPGFEPIAAPSTTPDNVVPFTPSQSTRSPIGPTGNVAQFGPVADAGGQIPWTGPDVGMRPNDPPSGPPYSGPPLYAVDGLFNPEGRGNYGNDAWEDSLEDNIFTGPSGVVQGGRSNSIDELRTRNNVIPGQFNQNQDTRVPPGTVTGQVAPIGPTRDAYQQQANDTGNIVQGIRPERGMAIEHPEGIGGFQHHVRGGENWVTHPYLDQPVGPFKTSEEAFDWALDYQDTPEFAAKSAAKQRGVGEQNYDKLSHQPGIGVPPEPHWTSQVGYGKNNDFFGTGTSRQESSPWEAPRDIFSDTEARRIVDRAFPPSTPEPQPATEYGQSAIDQEALQWMRGQDRVIADYQAGGNHLMDPDDTPSFQRAKGYEDLTPDVHKRYEVYDENDQLIHKTYDYDEAHRLADQENGYVNDINNRDEPSFAKVAGGGLSIDVDNRRAGVNLTKDYTTALSGIMVREATQNALDAVKDLGTDGQVRVRVTPARNGKNGMIEVHDNGGGLDETALAEKLVRLFATGKENAEGATGGKGIGSASYILGGEHFQIETVAVDSKDGKKYRILAGGTPDQFYDTEQGSDWDKTEVGSHVPTGTSIKVQLGTEQDTYDTRKMMRNIIAHSRNRDAKVTYDQYGSDPLGLNHPIHEITPDEYGDVTENIIPNSADDKLIGDFKYSDSNIKIAIPTHSDEARSTIEIHYLNNGMYQFSENKYLNEKTKGIPEHVIVDINPLVDEQHDNYPFINTREDVKKNMREYISKYIDENISAPAIDKKKNRTQELYDSMPVVSMGTKRNAVIFDPGQRLTTDELELVMNSPVVQGMVNHWDQVIDNIIQNTGRKAWADRLEGVGMVMDPGMHGVHIPNPTTGKSTILINPFIRAEQGHSPADNAFDNTITALHETAHIGKERGAEVSPVPMEMDLSDPRYIQFYQSYFQQIRDHGDVSYKNTGHQMDFVQRLGEVYAKFGPADTFAAADRLATIFSDGTGKYNPEFQKLLHIYSESRGRPETTEDLLSGTGVKQSDTGNGGEGEVPGDAGLLGDGAVGAKYAGAVDPAGINKADGLMRAGQATKDPRLKQLAGKAYEEEAGKITLAFLKDYGINELHRLYNDESGVLVIPSWKNIKHFAGWGQGRNSPAVQKAQYTWVDEVLSLPKNMTTIADMSFPFRQGLGAINTPQFWQAVHKMFGGLTPTGYDKINADILNLPAFRPGPIDPKTGLPTPSFADKIGFNLHSTPSKPGTRAQGIASRWLETGGSVPYLSATYRNTPVAMWFRASNRANVTFMNHLRANRLQFLLNRAQDLSLQAQRTGEARPNIFKQKYDLSTQAGVDAAKALDPYRNMQLAREIADAVNTFTGQAPLRSHILPFRGAEVNLEQSARALGRVFFSPGLAASRFRTLNPSTYIMATPQVRQQYLISALGTAMGWTGALGLMKMYFGDEMEIGTDPTSADFGKAVIGNYRVDPGASNQQFMVLAARLATGQYTSSATGKTRNIGEGFQARTAFDQGIDFTANKLEPMSKLAVDMARATGYQPVHVYDRTMQMFTPLIAQDIWELSQKRPDLLPMSVPAFFGMGTQIYDRGASESKFIRQADDWTYQGGGLRGLLMGTNYKGPGGQTSGRTYGTRKSATQQTYGTRRQ